MLFGYFQVSPNQFSPPTRSKLRVFAFDSKGSRDTDTKEILPIVGQKMNILFSSAVICVT